MEILDLVNLILDHGSGSYSSIAMLTAALWAAISFPGFSAEVAELMFAAACDVIAP